MTKFKVGESPAQYRQGHTEPSVGRAFSAIPLRVGLNKIAAQVAHEECVKIAEKRKRSKPGVSKWFRSIYSHGRTLMTDEEVIECRRLHEQEGWKAPDLATKYVVDKKYMYKILDYTLRSKLFPKIIK